MLSNQLVESILDDWSFWGKPIPKAQTREVQLPQRLCNDLALVIKGVRRCGKSTLLSQLPAYYGLPLEQCVYCNFEDPRFLDVLNFKLLTQIVEVARLRVGNDVPCYFFLDEIQNVRDWEKWLHVQLERPGNNFFVLTGSNAALLGGKYGTALTGRHISLELYPFNFSEFKNFCPKKNLEAYLSMGGFPRVLAYEHPHVLLQEYFNDIILRDVLRGASSRQPDTIKQVVKMAFDTSGSALSYRKISAAAGVSVDTVKQYLEACENAYLLFSCQYFAFSEKKRQQKQKKFYPVDPGLRDAVSGNLGRDIGKSLELLAYLRLKEKYEAVYYWQSDKQEELDFVCLKGNDIFPYQVTWQSPHERHYKALDAFYEHFPNAQEAQFITSDNADAHL